MWTYREHAVRQVCCEAAAWYKPVMDHPRKRIRAEEELVVDVKKKRMDVVGVC
jgi:hypothetical protein